MSKLHTVLLLAACLALTLADGQQLYYSTPVSPSANETTVNLFDVWPQVDALLKEQYWYYLRSASTLYQAGVDSPDEFLYFTIYRNIVGTFLTITTWTKTAQQTQINTFVRLGNGYAAGSGANYDPVAIDPFIVSLALGPNEYMVVVNADGTIKVTGNLTLYNQDITGNSNSFNITADMQDKCGQADKLNRATYWYYLDNSTLLSENDIPTSQQYYCVFVYSNIVGTFLSISHWDLVSKTAGINTLVRLGDGTAGAPVDIAPSILQLSSFN
jgi:hypothetical protein